VNERSSEALNELRDERSGSLRPVAPKAKQM